MKKVKILGLLLCLVLGMAALAACGASKEYQGKYSYTSQNYIDVTGEHTCNMFQVLVSEKEAFYTADNLRFDASSDGKYVYVELNDGLSLRANFNTSSKTISYSGRNYKK